MPAPATGDTRRSRIFYGWWIVVAVFVMLAISIGLGFYGVTVYLRALVVEQGFSLPATSGATALFFAVNGVAGLPIARLLQRRDPRPVVVAGALLAATALVMLGRVEQLWELYAVYALFGLGFAASSLVPATTVITRWFTRRRAIALSIASTGLSVGGIVLTPIIATLVLRHGLPAVTPWLALIFVVGIVPITLALLRGDPASMGLRPDGESAPAGPVTLTGVPYAEALHSRFFAAVTGAYVLVMLAQVGALAHLFNLVSQRVGEPFAATAVSALAASSVVARLVGGWLVTRVSMRGVTAALMLVQGVSLGALALGASPVALVAGAVALGVSVGNLLMLHPLLLADAFGVRDYPRVYSMSTLLMTIGVAGGPVLIGLLAARSGGYTLPLTLVGVACLVAGAVLLAGGPLHPPPEPAPVRVAAAGPFSRR